MSEPSAHGCNIIISGRGTSILNLVFPTFLHIVTLDSAYKGSFRTMCLNHVMSYTFSIGLGSLYTKSGGGFGGIFSQVP